MCNFFAIISFLLCVAIGQAAPMVDKEDVQAPEVPSVPSAIKIQIPDPQQTAPLTLKQQTISIPGECPPGSKPVQCPSKVEAESCSEECKSPQSKTTGSRWRKSKEKPKQKPKQKPQVKSKQNPKQRSIEALKETSAEALKETSTEPPKETSQENPKGWWNGFKNIILVCFGAFSESMVEVNGILTKLPQTIKFGGATVQRSKRTSSRRGRTIACCIFYRNLPPVKDYEEEEEEEEHETNVYPRPLSFVYVRGDSTENTSVIPDVPVPFSASHPPGVRSDIQNTTTSYCCVGRQLFNFRKLLKFIAKPQFNCCAVSLNLAGVEVN